MNLSLPYLYHFVIGPNGLWDLLSLSIFACTIASKIRLAQAFQESLHECSSISPLLAQLTQADWWHGPVSLSQPGPQWRECERSRQLSRMARVNLILEVIVPYLSLYQEWNTRFASDGNQTSF